MNSGRIEQVLPSGVAVDLGGTKIAAARVTDGQVGQVVRVQTDGAGGADQQVAAICDLLEKLQLQPDERVGVALSGRVSRDGIWHAVNTDTLSGVSSVPMKALLSARLNRDVTIENDATAAAIGEYLTGAGQGIASFGFVTVSTGVGGGVLLDGRPLKSANGLAGHIGFSTSRIATELCGSGRLCTVESLAGGRAIAALAAKLGHPDLDAKAVFQAHLDGQGWATGLIKHSAQAIAELCANLTAILGLQRIALGGSIGLAPGYLALVRTELSNEPELFRPQVMPTQLGANSAFVGILAQQD
jgi:N-acylmannosamine kinase